MYTRFIKPYGRPLLQYFAKGDLCPKPCRGCAVTVMDTATKGDVGVGTMADIQVSDQYGIRNTLPTLSGRFGNRLGNGRFHFHINFLFITQYPPQDARIE